jgi:heptose-I-phosphate ethanolaminephosphotransferase
MPTVPPRVRAVLAVVGLVLAAWTGWQAWRLGTTWHELRTVSGRLPDLPPLRGLTRRRDPGFPVKVWLHRVDSIERAVRMARAYAGMEIDVVFDSAASYFDVGHPPLPPAGISLDSLLAAVPVVGKHYFWIDFKNLTDGNAAAACAVLVGLARKYGLVGHMIVESPNPRALGCFADAGLYTSYYLFPDAGPATMDSTALVRYYEEVKANLAASRVNAVSSDYQSLPFIQAYLPETDALVWYLERKRDLRYRAVLFYLTHTREIRVVLVSKLSRGYR